MKRFRRIISLILCLLLLLTFVISCAPSEKQTAEESTTQSPDTTAPELTIEKLTAGFTAGEYTLDNSPVLARELLTVLYRLTGEEGYEELVALDDRFKPSQDTWYCDAVLWAGNKSIVGFEFTYYSVKPSSGRFPGFCGEGNSYETYLRCLDAPDAHPGLVRFLLGDEDEETEVTRSDALVALYRFTTKVLEKEVSSDGDISVYADSEKFPTKDDNAENSSLYRNAHKMYGEVYYELRDLYGEDILTQIWLWAIDAGIVETYPDNTLRPDATITRAEFAAMLTRFMDYVK